MKTFHFIEPHVKRHSLHLNKIQEFIMVLIKLRPNIPHLGGVMIYVKDILTDVVEIFNKSNGTCECIVLHLRSINLVTAVF